MPEKSGELSWGDVRRTLEEAIEMETRERETFLKVLEVREPELAVRVRSLLAGAEREGHQFEASHPMTALADEMGVLGGCAPGSKIGRYTVIRSLGAGGMGAVYEVRDAALNRSVAVKVIHPAMLSQTTLRRFEDEAIILARLRHPAIAQVYESGWIDGGCGGERLPFIAMEFVTNARPLTTFAVERGLDFRACIQLVLTVLDAVGHAHQRGVIHRDLKPANILVDESGRPKVIDFGIARSDDPEGERTATLTEWAAGTLRYMSPEQCRKEGTNDDPVNETDVRTDIYAMGVILYEVIEKRSPYASAVKGAPGSLVSLIAEVGEGRARTADVLDAPNSGVRRDLRAILSKAMARDPENRYPTAMSMAEDLQRLMKGEPVGARPQNLWQDARLFARRNRTLVVATIAVMVSLAAGTIAATVGLVRAQREAERARRIGSYFSNAIRSTSAAAVLDGRPPPMEAWLFGEMPWGAVRSANQGARIVDLLREAAERLTQEFGDDPLVQAQIAFQLAGAMNTLSETPQALELATKVWSIRRERLGEANDDTLRAMFFCCQIHPAGPKRILLEREGIELMRKRFGDADERTHQLRLWLVDAIMSQHREGGAEPTEAQLAIDASKAIPEIEAAERDAARDFGADSPPLWELRLIHSRAVMTLGDADAEARGKGMLAEAVAALERVLGTHNLKVAGAHVAMGDAWAESDPPRAEAVFRLALDEYLRSTGPSSGATYEARSYLHSSLLRQGKLEESEAIAREQLRDTRQALGEGAYQTIRAKMRLARSLVWEKKNLDEAESMARQGSQDVLAYDEKVPSGDYPAYYRAIWAEAIRLQGNAAEAGKMASELLKERKDFTGRAGWTDGMLELALGDALMDQGKMDESGAALRRAEAQFRKLKDPGSPLNMSLREAQARWRQLSESTK